MRIPTPLINLLARLGNESAKNERSLRQLLKPLSPTEISNNKASGRWHTPLPTPAGTSSPVKPTWAIDNFFGASRTSGSAHATPPALVEAGNSTLIAWISGRPATDHSAPPRPHRDSVDGDVFGELPTRSSGSNRETRTPAACNVALITALQEGALARNGRAQPAPAMKPAVPPKPPGLLARSRAAAAPAPSPQRRAPAAVPTKPVPAPKPAWLLARAKADIHTAPLEKQTMSQALRTALQLRVHDESFVAFKARLPDKAVYPHLAAARGHLPHDPPAARVALPAPAQPLERRPLPTELLAEIRAKGQAAADRPLLDMGSTCVASPMEDFFKRAFIANGIGDTPLSLRQISSSDSGVGSGPDDDASESGWDA